MTTKKHYVYKITCNKAGKFKNREYIGVKQVMAHIDPMSDPYMGGGQILEILKVKFGIENFSKEILFVFDNPDQAYNMENKLVNEDYIGREDTLNYTVGGKGRRCTDFAHEWKHDLMEHVSDVKLAQTLGIKERGRKPLRAIIQKHCDDINMQCEL